MFPLETDCIDFGCLSCGCISSLFAQNASVSTGKKKITKDILILWLLLFYGFSNNLWQIFAIFQYVFFFIYHECVETLLEKPKNIDHFELIPGNVARPKWRHHQLMLCLTFQFDTNSIAHKPFSYFST